MTEQITAPAGGQRSVALRLVAVLLGHLVPTAVIGYGVVLPAAGQPAGGPVGIGFAASLVGTIITYILGVRMARRYSIQRRPGPLGRVLSAQAAHPRGLLGAALGRLWVSETAAVNDRAIGLLAVSPGDRVLEIGGGSGRGVAELARRGARVTAVDPSPVMLAQARRRNAAAVRAGQVELVAGHADALPVADAAVDAVLAVHTLYFWPDLAAGLREIHRVLAPAGRVVLAFRSAEHGLPRRFDPAIYRVPTTPHAVETLRAAGFDRVTAEHDRHGTAYLAAYTRTP